MLNMDDYTPEENCLKDKVILVTGAGDGIGKAIAKAYAKLGATLILLGRNSKKLEAVYDEIEQAGGAEPVIVTLDLTKAMPQDYQDLIQHIDKTFGRLDGIVHNAAVVGSLTPIEHYPVEMWYQVLQTNLNAPFLITQLALPLLKKSPSASILFSHDDATTAYWGAYGVSKSALKTMSQILSDELETNTNIQVNSITLPPVATRLRKKVQPGGSPSIKLPAPEDVIAPFIYHMTENAKHVIPA